MIINFPATNTTTLPVDREASLRSFSKMLLRFLFYLQEVIIMFSPFLCLIFNDCTTGDTCRQVVLEITDGFACNIPAANYSDSASSGSRSVISMISSMENPLDFNFRAVSNCWQCAFFRPSSSPSFSPASLAAVIFNP